MGIDSEYGFYSCIFIENVLNNTPIKRIYNNSVKWFFAKIKNNIKI